jgi:hypothetical protein
MAEISSYPLKTPKSGDLIMFSETYDASAASPVVGNPTKSATIASVKSVVQNTLPGITEHVDNAAALTAGLTIGQRYRTGDLLKIVH